MITDMHIYNKYIIRSETDLDGIITNVSEAFCKICGYTKKELIGNKHNIVKHEDTPISIFENLWLTIKDDKPWTGIIKNKTKDGDAYWVDSYIFPKYENEKKIGYISLRFDVTSQFKLIDLNSELKLNISKYKKLFDSIDSGVAIVDVNGNYLDVNNYLCKLMGYTKEEFLSGNILINHKNKMKELEKFIDGDIKNLDYNEEKECATRNGNKIWINANYKYFAENQILVTVSNITSDRELTKASSLLVKQSKDADLGEMISMIAHQWRQPLATIEAIISKINAKRELQIYKGSDLTSDTRKISSIVSHLSKTIDFFRNYLKPKKGEMKPFLTILESVMTIIAPLCSNSKIEIKVKNDSKIDPLTDERIDQVILNLIKNSFDAYVEKEMIASIEIEIIDLDKNFAIKITDHAGGIEEKIIEKIFEPYFSTKSKNGTGLGLYMCKNIVDQILDGKFYYENNNGIGISFYIELNKSKEEN